jgi:hypothetical protein
MPSLKSLLRHLWRWKAQPTTHPSPVDAIVRVLREAEKQHGSRRSE